MIDRLTVAKRLAAGFGLVATIGIGIATYGATTLGSLSHDTSQIATERMLKVAEFTELKDNQNAISRHARNIIISDDAGFRDDQKKSIAQLRSRNTELVGALEKTIVLPEGRKLLQQLVENRGPYNAATDQAIALAQAGDKAGAGRMLVGEVKRLEDIVFHDVEASRAQQKLISETMAASTSAAAGLGGRLMIGLGILMAVLGAAVSWLTGRHIRRALGAEPAELSMLVGQIAGGDLATPIPVADGDQHSVTAAMARMQLALAGVVSTVRQNSESVATASAQIAQGNQDLAGRTEQQASALQQTSATMEQLGTTVRHNADSANQANQLAQAAAVVATKGGEMVGNVVTTMQGISHSSRQIGDIIGVIDSIAFQTNILALNAAVEAARAGDQGRGFAVVASEVRSLAQRSADAAKEIKTLIGRSIEQVEKGTVLVDQAGSTMSEIVHSIQRVSDIVAEISSASDEQSAGVQQVGLAVNQMDQSTQQNAALVEQSTAAAESLKAQAQELVQAVAVFRLSHQSAQLTPHGPRSTPAMAPVKSSIKAPDSKAAWTPAKAQTGAPAVERRGPDRATNVIRPAFAGNPATGTAGRPAAAASHAAAPVQAHEPALSHGMASKTGTDEWESF